MVTQRVEVVRVFIATADRQNACPQDVVQLVGYPGGITQVGNAGSQLRADPHGALSLRQQQHTAIRGQPTTVKRSSYFLACNRWTIPIGVSSIMRTVSPQDGHSMVRESLSVLKSTTR